MKHTKCYVKDYPRPQLVRGGWQNLCGEWRFGFGDEVTAADALQGKLNRKITVPFSYECKASGIGDESSHKLVWYAREIAGQKGKRTLINFEGADYKTEVYVNGRLVGSHVGAYSRFTFDLTDHLGGGKNLLVVRCEDPDAPIQVRGKQRWKKESFGCWYVQTTGIYKPVWLEFVEETYLTALKITPSVKDNSVRFDATVSKPSVDAEIRYEISFGGAKIKTACVSAADPINGVTVKLDSGELTYQVEHWNVGNPALYDVDITVSVAGKVVDTVGSYFGLRDYRAENGKLMLNEGQFYSRLLLDQGYWKDSGLTPPDEDALKRDIDLCKAMGFNGVRKHQKVEDERFLYYADVLGFAVWCELPSNHFRCDEATAHITAEWLNIVRQNYSHPSVFTWVIFNESWGVREIASDASEQNLATGLYYLTKSIDPMRPVISNDGWRHTVSDVLTLHCYEQDGDKLYSYYDAEEKLTAGGAFERQFPPFANGFKYGGQPIILSEFGGTAYVRDCENKAWGYGSGVKNDEEFLSRFASLVGAVEKMNISGYCYTQLTDVQQEVNGLLHIDRTPKVPLERIAETVAKK